jgi:TRAP-type transport system small permease protein
MPGSFGRAVDRLTEALLRLGAVAAEAMLVVLVGVVFAEVVARSFLGFSIELVEEASGYLLVGIIFLGLGQSIVSGALLRVDFIINALGERARTGLDRAYAAVGVVVLLIYLREAILLVLSSYQRGTLSSTDLPIPQWIPQCSMVVGLVLGALAFARLVMRPVPTDATGADV